jgi:festuclavine dehydrogenase
MLCCVLHGSWVSCPAPSSRVLPAFTDFCYIENLIEPGFVYTITQLNSIFTAAQDGQIPFISADDIADVAYHALTDAKAFNSDLRVLGPELLTYDQVSKLVET